jgi:hypothetical protein
VVENPESRLILRLIAEHGQLEKNFRCKKCWKLIFRVYYERPKLKKPKSHEAAFRKMVENGQNTVSAILFLPHLKWSKKSGPNYTE